MMLRPSELKEQMEELFDALESPALEGLHDQLEHAAIAPNRAAVEDCITLLGEELAENGYYVTRPAITAFVLGLAATKPTKNTIRQSLGGPR